METRLTLPIGHLVLQHPTGTLENVLLNGSQVNDISSMTVVCRGLRGQPDLHLKCLELFSSRQSSMLKRLGDYWYDSENYSKALQAYEKRRAASPGDVSNLASIGGCQYLLERWRDAEDTLRIALRLQHDNFPALVNISIVLNDASNWREASAFIENALVKKPTDPHARLEFAISCIYHGQHKPASTILAALTASNAFNRFFQSRLIFAKALLAYYSADLRACEVELNEAVRVFPRRLYEQQSYKLRMRIFSRHEKLLVWREDAQHLLNQLGEHLFRKVVRFL